MGTPCRLAPTAEWTSSGNLANSGQVVPASITSIISVLVEEDHGYPEVNMTLESVDKKDQISGSFSSNLFLYKIRSVTSISRCLFRQVISNYSGRLFYHFLHNRILAFLKYFCNSNQRYFCNCSKFPWCQFGCLNSRVPNKRVLILWWYSLQHVLIWNTRGT